MNCTLVAGVWPAGLVAKRVGTGVIHKIGSCYCCVEVAGSSLTHLNVGLAIRCCKLAEHCLELTVSSSREIEICTEKVDTPHMLQTLWVADSRRKTQAIYTSQAHIGILHVPQHILRRAEVNRK